MLLYERKTRIRVACSRAQREHVIRDGSGHRRQKEGLGPPMPGMHPRLHYTRNAAQPAEANFRRAPVKASGWRREEIREYSGTAYSVVFVSGSDVLYYRPFGAQYVSPGFLTLGCQGKIIIEAL